MLKQSTKQEQIGKYICATCERVCMSISTIEEEQQEFQELWPSQKIEEGRRVLPINLIFTSLLLSALCRGLFVIRFTLSYKSSFQSLIFLQLYKLSSSLQVSE